MRTLLLLLLAVGLPTASAQITLRASDVAVFFAPGSSYTNTEYTFDETNVNLGTAASSAQTLRFDNLTLPGLDLSSETITIQAPGTLYGASFFPTATAALSFTEVDETGATSTGSLFYRLANDGFFALGVGFSTQDGTDTQEVVTGNNPALRQLALPLTLGTAWNSSTNEQLLASNPPLPFFVTTSTALSVVVDGFGTVRFPDGVQEEALRYTEDRVLTQSFPPFINLRFRTKSVTWQSARRVVSADVDTLYTGGAARITSFSFSTTGGGTATEDGSTAPRTFALAAAYPNPFNPQTTVPFTLTQRTAVRLAVYDVLGREVAVLADGVYPPGTHTPTFAATGLPSGVYVARLTAAGQVQTRTLTLSK